MATISSILGIQGASGQGWGCGALLGPADLYLAQIPALLTPSHLLPENLLDHLCWAHALDNSSEVPANLTWHLHPTWPHPAATYAIYSSSSWNPTPQLPTGTRLLQSQVWMLGLELQHLHVHDCNQG